MKESTPLFVISLDFELYWGLFDKVSLGEYGTNLTGVHSVVPSILDLFRTYELHATWATVGMLMYSDLDTLRRQLPPEEQQPQYKNEYLSAYTHIKMYESKLRQTPEYYFAPELVTLINETPNQEIGSHTFSHYYCREDTSSAFAADCGAMRRSAERFDIVPHALVFPRNQVNDAALHVAHTHGITCYRGNEQNVLYKNGTESPLWTRALRLVDAYINLTGHHAHMIQQSKTDTPVNVPASRFLRPWSRSLAILEPLRMRRITRAMTSAAQSGQIFHLWWHPHNFGVNQEENLAVLREIAEHFKTLKKQYGMQSATMSEAASHAA